MILKNSITAYLKEKGLYHETDEMLIDLLVENMGIIKTCIKDFGTNGVMINVCKDPDREYFQPNPAVHMFNRAVDQVKSLYTQLSLSPSVRQKLNLEIEGVLEDFDIQFN